MWSNNYETVREVGWLNAPSRADPVPQCVMPRRCRDLEHGGHYPTPPSDDMTGGIVALIICIIMFVLFFFALAHPANRMYAHYYPNHPSPMYWYPYR